MPWRGVFALNKSQKHPPTEEKLTRLSARLAHNEHYCTLDATP
jgi:hypothetical protein